MDLRLAEIDAITNSSSFQPDAINVSKEETSADTPFTTIMLIEVYCLPVICLFGLVGNTLSAITFFKKSMRRTSCSIYLAVRSISDNGFLLALILIWISIVFKLELSRVQVVCKTIILLTYISGCVSVWLVVFITVDNYIRICRPFVVKPVSTKISHVLTLSLCICAFGVYSLPLWIIDTDCTHNEQYCNITQALVYTDTLLTLIIPSILIIGFMTAIVFKLISSKCVRGSPEMRAKPNRKYLPATKITKMLLIVSVMFFLLNFPSHIIRLYILINSFIKGQNQIPNQQRTIQTIFQLIYYLSFAVNIMVYITFGKNFRATFKQTFCKQILSHMERRSAEAINTVPKGQQQRQFSLTVVLGSKGSCYFSLPSCGQRTEFTT